MEVLNPIEGKTYKLPVGYMFDPTDQVLVDYYLRKRVTAQPLPNDLIRDYDVHQTEPWELPGGSSQIHKHKSSLSICRSFFGFLISDLLAFRWTPKIYLLVSFQSETFSQIKIFICL